MAGARDGDVRAAARHVLRELRVQLRAVLDPGDPSVQPWRKRADEARRRVGLTVSNAEATLQRLIMEETPSPQRVEAAMTMLTYSRRMATTLSAIAAARAGGELMADNGTTESIASCLDALAVSLDAGATTAALAPGDARDVEDVIDVTAASSSSLNAQLERLRIQLAVLRRAVHRY